MNEVLVRLTDLLEHRRIDPESDAILDAILGAVADVMERLSVIAYGDQDATPPVPAGDSLNDPAVAPLWAMPHAALYVGARMPTRLVGESDAAYEARARAWVTYPPGIKRGSHEAIRRVVQPLLTGTRFVGITDQEGGNPYLLLVRTITRETPDPAAVRAAIEGSYVSGGPRGALRAELQLDYVVAAEVTFAEGARRWNAVAGTVTFSNVTTGDVS